MVRKKVRKVNSAASTFFFCISQALTGKMHQVWHYQLTFVPQKLLSTK
jgi:hypothetical protein